jgi:pimeloyl-ACP methyl ester carboxylesterase
MEPNSKKISILLLHGAIGSNKQLHSLQESLSQYYDVHAPNFPGHGGAEIPADFSITAFADFVQNYIATNRLYQPVVFGYSMGGYIAFYLSLQYPHLFSKIITLATKFHWNETTAIAETRMLQPDILEQKVPKFAQALALRHFPQDWKTVLTHTAGLLQKLGANPLLNEEAYQKIAVPCLLMIGDRDTMVSVEETAAVYRALTLAQFSVLPATPHPIEQAPIELLTSIIHAFTNTTKGN